MHRSVIFVRPGAVREQPRDARLHFTAGVTRVASGHGSQALPELVGALREVLGHVVENLSAVVPARPRPRGRGMGCLYRVPDVLAIPLRDLGEERARRAQDLPAIALVGTDLLASDEEFVSPINGRERGAGSGSLHGLASRGSLRLRKVPLPAPRSPSQGGLQVFPHALPSALSSKAGFPVAPESRRGVEQIGAVDPDDTRLDLRGHVEREVDVLRPHARGESVRRVVGELDRLGRRAEGHRDQHRAEDLDLRDGGRRRNVREQGRRIEVAVRRARPGGLPQGGPLPDAGVHERTDPLELHRGHDRAHVDRLVERRAHAELLHSCP